MKELWGASLLLASTAGLAFAGLQGTGGNPPGFVQRKGTTLCLI